MRYWMYLYLKVSSRVEETRKKNNILKIDGPDQTPGPIRDTTGRTRGIS